MRGSSLGVFAAFAVAGCPGGAKDPASRAGETICPDQRRSLDCESEVAYQGVKTEGGVHVLNIGGANGAFATTALRQINQDVENYIAGQTRLCREYNACIVTPEQYHAEAQKARDSLGGVGTLVARVNGADPRERANAADQILATVTKKGAGPALAISMSLEAELPPSVGGGQLVVPQNYPVPTNSRVAFKFAVTQSAHVYLFQVDAHQRISVLFPDDRIATKNPLPPGKETRIPEDGLRFRLDEHGIGTENVYIVASAHPLASLEQALARVRSGKLNEITQDPLLSGFGTMEPGSPTCARTRDLVLDADPAPVAAPADGCTKTRGLVLDAAPQPNQRVAQSLEARVAAGDDVIVKVFRFRHVSESEYKARHAEYNADTQQGIKTRGIAIEN